MTTISDATPEAPAGESLDDIRRSISEAVGTDPKTSSVSPEETPKRRRGRPPGSKNRAKEQEPVVAIPPPETFGPIYTVIFDVIARRSGDHWKLQPQEANQLGVLTHSVAMKYGEYFGRFGPEIMLCSYLGIVVVSRVIVGRQEETKPEQSAVNVPLPERWAGPSA